MDTKAFWEAIKEFFRVVVLAIIPVLISALQENRFDWRVIAVVGAIAGLRFIDKWLHKANANLPKTKQKSGMLGEKGLTGF